MSTIVFPLEFQIASPESFWDKTFMESSLKTTLSLFSACVLVSGCVPMRYSELTGNNRNNLTWPQGKGTMAETSYSIPVYRGWPERPYEVLGSVRFVDPGKYW